jgi:pimeloyl-ACP methyl ester carboxylesterase
MNLRRLDTDGLAQQILQAGEGPLVLLIHGFPELAVSWRLQVQALADAGFQAVAPDMRGYGGTDKPQASEAYSLLHLVGDMVDLVRALERDRCVVVGHDWGAAVAWHCALIRPDIFTAVAGLSVPFQPRRAKGPPSAAMAALASRHGRDLYIRRLQEPDAHEPFDADPSGALRRMFYGYDGSTPPERRSSGFVAAGETLISGVAEDAPLPPWMEPSHFAHYVEAFTRGGFRGPVDWYRCIDLNWSLTAWLQDAQIRTPGAFMVGEQDPVRAYAGAHEKSLKDWIRDLRDLRVSQGAGHWLQQERPQEVNAFLLDFLRGL